MEAKNDFGRDLRQALADYPDRPVVVFVSGSAAVVPDGWTACTDNCGVGVGQYLACPESMLPREAWVYVDKRELFDNLAEDIDEENNYCLECSELKPLVHEMMKKFEPYWRDCIIIWVH